MLVREEIYGNYAYDDRVALTSENFELIHSDWFRFNAVGFNDGKLMAIDGEVVSNNAKWTSMRNAEG